MTTQVAAASRAAGQPSEIKIPQLPLREHGLTNVPAVPLDFVGMIDTLMKLGGKVKQREQALQGLSKTITIGGSTAPAYAFLFGREAADTKAAAALERLRAFLNRNPLGILSSLVDKLKAQDEELVRAAADRRRRSHHSFARRSKAMVDGLDDISRRLHLGPAASERVGGDSGRDAAREGDRGLLSHHRPLRSVLQPDSDQER